MIYKKTYYFFKSALSNKICDDIISEGFSRSPGTALTGKEKPKSKVQMENVMKLRNSSTSWISEVWLNKEIRPYIERANQKAGWNFNLTNVEPSQFTVYKEGQFYDWHQDSHGQLYDDKDEWNGLMRKLSVTVSLSDPQEYEGGRLEFAIDGIHPDKTLKSTVKEIMPRGSIVIFPSYVWHRIQPVTKGKRYSLVQWHLGPGYI
jgi:PKHD-type hydroxylase